MVVIVVYIFATTYLVRGVSGYDETILSLKSLLILQRLNNFNYMMRTLSICIDQDGVCNANYSLSVLIVEHVSPAFYPIFDFFPSINHSKCQIVNLRAWIRSWLLLVVNTNVISRSHYILRCCHRLPSTCSFHEALWAAISLLEWFEIESGRHEGAQAIDYQTTTTRDLLERWKLGRNPTEKRCGSTC